MVFFGVGGGGGRGGKRGDGRRRDEGVRSFGGWWVVGWEVGSRSEEREGDCVRD